MTPKPPSSQKKDVPVSFLCLHLYLMLTLFVSGKNWLSQYNPGILVRMCASVVKIISSTRFDKKVVVLFFAFLQFWSGPFAA